MLKTDIEKRYSNHYLFSLRNVGESRQLRGKVTLFVFYINKKTFFKKKFDTAPFERKLRSALDRLTREAKSCKTELSFDIVTEYVFSKHTEDPQRRWVQDALKTYCTQDFKVFQKSARSVFKCDEAPVLFVFENDILSHARCAEKSTPDADEYSVVDINEPERTIIHELLHQFGATDYYLPYECYDMGRMYIPESIMVDGTTIDALTKYLIGWTDYIPENVINFLESVKHITLEDRMRAKLERMKNPLNVKGIPTDALGTPLPRTIGSQKTETGSNTALSMLHVPLDTKENIVMAAAFGDMNALYKIGMSYMNGDFFQKDEKQAKDWFEKAAEQGHVLAMRMLSNIYENGLGVPKDKQLSKHYLKKAADAGHIASQREYGEYYCRGTERFRWIKMAAEKCNMYALYDVAVMYHRGEGVERNEELAQYYRKKAVENGYSLDQREFND